MKIQGASRAAQYAIVGRMRPAGRVFETPDIRCAEFKALQPLFQLFSTPFTVQIDDAAEELQMELAELQSDTILKQKHADVGIPKFHSFIS